ncbi:MAG: M48 family metalloprotease [Gammaproteobacteria bacterium]|nr:M48 family metalloprotease [Gammaproteobacteria bacterium]
MPKQYRVVSQAAPVKGKIAQEVIQGLARLGMKAEQATALLQKPLTIKKDLDNPKALEYLEKFTEAGLLVKIEAYEVEHAPQVKAARSQSDEVFALLESTFAQPVKPTTLTRDYQKSFAIAVATSLVSPLIYVGLIVLSVWALVWYFTSGHGLRFGGVEWRGKFMLFLGALSWVVPAVAGSVLILFLLYPLWPQGKPPKPYVLDRKKHARFYKLIEKMTAAIGVPAPQFIEVIPDMNAAAGPVHGMASLAKGELKLVIGMSLVMGTSVQQFMGVLAHEFGHFSQRSSMMAYIWINTVNHWLWQCGYGQDVWTERLERWQDQFENEIAQVSLFVTEWLLKLVRLLFQNLYKLNVRLTNAMSQQMEFDADLYETRVVGSAQFRAGTLVLRRMGYAWSQARQTTFQGLHEQDKMLRNLPAATLEIASGFSPGLLKKIEDDLQVEETRHWDTHPADLERIANAENAGERGMLHCELPASVLFSEVEKLCETATLNWYLKLGISGAREFMVDNALLLQAVKPVSKPDSKPDGKAAASERAAQNSGVESSGMQNSGVAPALAARNSEPAETKSQVNDDGTIEWTGSRHKPKADDA